MMKNTRDEGVEDSQSRIHGNFCNVEKNFASYESYSGKRTSASNI